MENKSKLRIFLLVAMLFTGHFFMDIYKIGVKDGKANRHALVAKK